MYDKNKIIPGLVIFIALVTLPLWYNPVMGKASAMPELELPDAEQQCVLPSVEMREQHMQILDAWRDEVVREGQRYYVHPDGKTYEKSLTNTCLGCHTKRAEFCDKCHDYAGVVPYCWDCHVEREAK